MDKYKIYYSPVASADLKGIYTHIAFNLKEKTIAENQVNRIREAIKNLDTLPNRNSRLELELKQPEEMRKMVVNNYIIFYIVDEQRKEVNVARILYGGRDIKSILND